MQLSKYFLVSLLLAGMTLGTAWAIRGQFGHEQGAAWAGGIGCLGVILLARRADWYPKALRAMLAGAIGWGVGGLMSYGLVVGYGRGVDFPNVFYGFAMLFVIGGLYGFIGGGLFGLVLEETTEKPVPWPTLLVEMVVLGIVAYFFLIEEWGWRMTPPRSELWAACLGMALALGWFQHRRGYSAAWRVALYAGLGAGFGFAFGNFLQVLGNTSGIKFNFWNVMEYSLGFFGGLGMAYGTLTAAWPDRTEAPRSSQFAVFFVTLFIPLVVWDQSFGTQRLLKTLQPLTNLDVADLTRVTQGVALLTIVVAGICWTYYLGRQRKGGSPGYAFLSLFFLSHLGLYTLCSWLITGALLSSYRIEQYLYVANLGVIGFFLNRIEKPTFRKSEHAWRWSLVMMGVLLTIALLALVAVSLHGPLKGTQVRFQFYLMPFSVRMLPG